MQLRSAPKCSGSAQRTVPPAETLRRAAPVARSLGVTRLADITGLDRLGIPTYSAMVPRSRDVLSVYNGKGLRRIEAQAGALMEAIERQCALRAENPVVRASWREQSAAAPTLDPRSVNWPLQPDWTETTPGYWLEGFDLLKEQAVWVPATLAGYLSEPHWGPSFYRCTSTHGLAAGNTLEEAVLQAVYELVERDTWTEAEILAHWLPLARRQAFLGPEFTEGPDDFERYPLVEFTGASGAVRKVWNAFVAAGLNPIVRDLTGTLGVPTILAAVADLDTAEQPLAHLGLGTHLCGESAVIRALTELAQSRAVDIQAVREDIREADQLEASRYARHAQRISRVDRNSWWHTPGVRKRRLEELSNEATSDVREDLYRVFGRLKAAGLERVVVVDFSPPDTGVFVVRVIIPGIETWAADHAQLGPRATAWWRRHV